ncbi:MAG TPA: nicotinate (nicotinamide) nucleotide adenylyltransferase [Myxococcota bacterium]|jgi:nicotinate-nucleotide adenylyltransferase|nr:nicotinate (nicotinamide) nucleotide adenylyltransferase [Myxococcota bacterium]
MATPVPGERTVALFGGSFNPPHMGHVLLCAYALGTRPVDALWLVPAFRHAFGKVLAPFEDRLEMCRLAAALLGPRAVASDVEGKLGGESRTLVTLRHLRAAHPERRFVLLVGSDVLSERQAWFGWEEIAATTEVWAVRRAGAPPPDPGGVATEPSIEIPDVSSTEVRRRLAADEPVGHLVPRTVLDYVRRRGLYRHHPAENA